MSVDLADAAGECRNPIRRILAGLGEKVWAYWDEVRHAAAVIGTVFQVGICPRYWVRAARSEFARQVLAIGYPVRVVHIQTPRWQGYKVEPIFVFPVSSSATTVP